MLKYIENKLLFEMNGITYRLTSQPYEPCLYINYNGQIIKTIHNAWTWDTISETFQKGEKIEALDGKCYSEEEFCSVLEKFMESSRTEADFAFIAKTEEI
ncbi:MAG: hypothetical protein IJS60_03110 [Abditibacteriota bacterium]|nr:hypothetical protein [Abditibacteriota bacterium]